MATWATTADVLDMTGATVTGTQLNQAEATIVTYANRTPDTAGLSTRDLYWLKQAVCYQAPWQAGQAGYHQRSNAFRVDTDGLELERDTEHSVTLAPLAARALKNLSWKADHTRRGRNVRYPTGAAVVDVYADDGQTDRLYPWRSL